MIRRRTCIRPVSHARAKALRLYRTLRRRFLERPENRWCMVALKLEGKRVPATEVHHVRGRIHDLLNDTRFWLAVSQAGHGWINANPAAARGHGFLCRRGQWNTPVAENIVA